MFIKNKPELLVLIIAATISIVIVNWHVIWHGWHWNKDNYINGLVALGTIILAIVTVFLNRNAQIQAQQATRATNFNTWYQITESAISRVKSCLGQKDWGMSYTHIVTYKECLDMCDLDQSDREILKNLLWCALGPEFWTEYTCGKNLKCSATNPRELETYRSFFITVGDFLYLVADSHGQKFDYKRSSFKCL